MYFKRKKYNNNTFSRKDNNKKKKKVVNSENINRKKRKVVESVNNLNRTLMIGFSNSGRILIYYNLMIYVLLQKQEPVFVVTKSLNQYPTIKAQTLDEIHR